MVKFFSTPEEVVDGVADVTRRLKEKLDTKKVPPRIRKKVEKEGLRPDEG